MCKTFTGFLSGPLVRTTRTWKGPDPDNGPIVSGPPVGRNLTVRGDKGGEKLFTPWQLGSPENKQGESLSCQASCFSFCSIRSPSLLDKGVNIQGVPPPRFAVPHASHLEASSWTIPEGHCADFLGTPSPIELTIKSNHHDGEVKERKRNGWRAHSTLWGTLPVI